MSSFWIAELGQRFDYLGNTVTMICKHLSDHYCGVYSLLWSGETFTLVGASYTDQFDTNALIRQTGQLFLFCRIIINVFLVMYCRSIFCYSNCSSPRFGGVWNIQGQNICEFHFQHHITSFYRAGLTFGILWYNKQVLRTSTSTITHENYLRHWDVFQWLHAWPKLLDVFQTTQCYWLSDSRHWY